MKTQDRIFDAMESPARACLHDLFRRTMPDYECGKCTRRTLHCVQPDAWTTRHVPLMKSDLLQSHFTPCSKSRGNLFHVHARGAIAESCSRSFMAWPQLFLQVDCLPLLQSI
ncbi:unnamed protein product [Musa textilis]